ncbi:helix-turn-helix domain-containing protein [Chitinophagaceae bacterium LB-8]|uniref:Helix-turn-helix domain-containing protein n=1 Tax=Paraflavisolibacter caeni TaxID=2982496 RepID=A0A9X2Y0R2_9BACT|nr:helix-turn-helix domain-containing protein [Paraflavisolibacter caeni]MCU7552855.1 helix-turn-helix domain-containing protein [Paraflavisolibacter caeni]
MSVEILTRHDLMSFKEELISELKQIISKEQIEQKEWLKTNEVLRMLKVSPGTLQTLRVNGTLKYTKLGGIIYYDNEHIQALLNKEKK